MQNPALDGDKSPRACGPDAPSFSKIFWMCILMVPLAVPSFVRDLLIGQPACGHKPEHFHFARRQRHVCGKYSLSRWATSCGIRRLPECTVRIARSTSVCTISFSMYPRTPASSAR